MKMKVNEIFLSIQGEGKQTGLPTVFVRFTGCNLRCKYCDTTYAYNEGIELDIGEIITKINAFEYKRVCITGGEPLMQMNLQELLDKLSDYEVSIETNGSISLKELKLHKNQHFVMDIKAISSGVSTKNHEDNMMYLRDNDEIKIVLENENDYEFAKEYIKKHYKKGQIIFSTVYGKMDNKELIKWILRDKLNVRFQIQLHKYIWNENTRGV